MRRLSLTLPEQIVERIDSEKGDVNRSRYILRLLEKAIEEVHEQQGDQENCQR
jgi:metal-responsive CopG/Arc/MetJ family transcriptional regulator